MLQVACGKGHVLDHTAIVGVKQVRRAVISDEQDRIRDLKRRLVDVPRPLSVQSAVGRPTDAQRSPLVLERMIVDHDDQTVQPARRNPAQRTGQYCLDRIRP